MFLSKRQNKNRISNEELIKKINEHGDKISYTLDVDKTIFDGMASILYVKCNKCGYEYQIQAQAFLKISSICRHRKVKPKTYYPNKIKLKEVKNKIKQYCKLNNLIFLNEKEFEYKTALTNNVILKCNKCGYSFSKSFIRIKSQLKQPTKCGGCHSFKETSEIKKSKLSKHLETLNFSIINPNYEYKDIKNTIIDIKCNKCSKIVQNKTYQQLNGLQKKCDICLWNEDYTKFLAFLENKNYSLVEPLTFKQNRLFKSEKIKLKCNKCGHIWTPSYFNIIKGHGCIKCAVGNRLYRPRLTTEQFIKRALNVPYFNNININFDYSQVEYKGSLTKVCIGNPKYGKCWQIAQNHWKGHIPQYINSEGKRCMSKQSIERALTTKLNKKEIDE